MRISCVRTAFAPSGTSPSLRAMRCTCVSTGIMSRPIEKHRTHAAVFTPTHQCQQDFGSTERQQAKGKFLPGCHDRHADPLLATEIEQPELMAQLVAWREARELEYASTAVDEAEIDADLNRELKMLGYME